ncbi:hypothetical protein C8F01DRAFT_1146247 [Mycena amicta]|nr:hypothetical protein C8F01DRAFT_1146247 [Mycena amicta]
MSEGFGLPSGSLPGSTAASPSWSPAAGSLILREVSPAPSSADLLEEEGDREVAQLQTTATPSYPEMVAKCTVNPRYYFDDRISFFKVENQKFKVHRHFLVRDSVHFQELFAGPLGDFGDRESEAIPLEGIGSAEFECLLDFFYTGMYRQTNFSLSQWITLLSISTRLRFDRLRAHAIQAIEDNPTELDPIQKIVLAAKYHIPTWFAPAYATLCRRPGCLEEWEADKIGLKRTVLVAKAREAYRVALGQMMLTRPPSPLYWGRPRDPLLSPMPQDLEQTKAERIVEEVFFGA